MIETKKFQAAFGMFGMLAGQEYREEMSHSENVKEFTEQQKFDEFLGHITDYTVTASIAVLDNWHSIAPSDEEKVFAAMTADMDSLMTIPESAKIQRMGGLGRIGISVPQYCSLGELWKFGKP